MIFSFHTFFTPFYLLLLGFVTCCFWPAT